MRATTVLLAAMLAFSAVVVAAPTASATMCLIDVKDPVPGVVCAVNLTLRCVQGLPDPCPA